MTSTPDSPSAVGLADRAGCSLQCPQIQRAKAGYQSHDPGRGEEGSLKTTCRYLVLCPVELLGHAIASLRCQDIDGTTVASQIQGSTVVEVTGSMTPATDDDEPDQEGCDVQDYHECADAGISASIGMTWPDTDDEYGACCRRATDDDLQLAPRIASQGQGHQSFDIHTPNEGEAANFGGNDLDKPHEDAHRCHHQDDESFNMNVLQAAEAGHTAAELPRPLASSRILKVRISECSTAASERGMNELKLAEAAVVLTSTQGCDSPRLASEQEHNAHSVQPSVGGDPSAGSVVKCDTLVAAYLPRPPEPGCQCTRENEAPTLPCLFELAQLDLSHIDFDIISQEEKDSVAFLKHICIPGELHLSADWCAQQSYLSHPGGTTSQCRFVRAAVALIHGD